MKFKNPTPKHLRDRINRIEAICNLTKEELGFTDDDINQEQNRIKKNNTK